MESYQHTSNDREPYNVNQNPRAKSDPSAPAFDSRTVGPRAFRKNKMKTNQLMASVNSKGLGE